MKKEETQKLCIGVVFTIFFFLLFRNITDAALWFDEGIEYWYSKSIHAVIPGETSVSTMYERIVSTFQPPLYNVLMYIWLKINDTEIWFRLFGILMGFGAGVGLYKTIKLVGNTTIALISILFLGNIYRYVYYVLECAEYNLMFFMVSLTLYYFIKCINDSAVKNIGLFTLFCVLSVYSQYGAVFVVVGCAITLLIWNFVKNRRFACKNLAISYMCAGVFAAVPLFVFFVKKQLENQVGYKGSTIGLNIEGNLIVDVVKGLRSVLEFNFIPNNILMKWTIYLILITVVIMTVILLMRKDEVVVPFFVACVLIALTYCVLVKLGIYGYGGWGERYCLFMIPPVICYCSVVISCFWKIYSSINFRFVSESGIRIIWGILLGAVFMYSIQGYQYIGNGWEKEDNKEMFKYWYTQTPSDCETLVYYGAVPVFSFYLEHEDNYVASDIINANQRNITLQQAKRNCTKEEYITYFSEAYMSMPEEICFLCSHYIVDDWEIMLEALEELGYEHQMVWEGKQAQVIMLTLN